MNYGALQQKILENPLELQAKGCIFMPHTEVTICVGCIIPALFFFFSSFHSQQTAKSGAHHQLHQYALKKHELVWKSAGTAGLLALPRASWVLPSGVQGTDTPRLLLAALHVRRRYSSAQRKRLCKISSSLAGCEGSN